MREAFDKEALQIHGVRLVGVALQIKDESPRRRCFPSLAKEEPFLDPRQVALP